jgi:hypothetical protein
MALQGRRIALAPIAGKLVGSIYRRTSPLQRRELRIALCNQCLLSLNLLTQKRGSGFDNIATDSAKIERSHANELIPTAS